MTVRPTVLLACAALAAGGLAACGDDEEEPANAGASSSTETQESSGGAYGGGGDTATEEATTQAAASGAVAVTMQDLGFAPAEATAKVGQTVTWTNADDGIPHNVKATSGASFSSDTFEQGGTYEQKLTEAGKIDYVCTLHPGMEGTITVTE